MFLDVDANKARVDAAQELVSVAHDDGAYVVQMSTQSFIGTFLHPTPLTMLCDQEGDLWLAFFAGKRRADQYDTSGFTGVAARRFPQVFLRLKSCTMAA